LLGDCAKTVEGRPFSCTAFGHLDVVMQATPARLIVAGAISQMLTGA